MGIMMKGDKDILTLQVKGDGPIEGITVTADSKGRVKGYVGNPDVIIPALSLAFLLASATFDRKCADSRDASSSLIRR